ncbi:DUF983 domain-containing protein [Aureimonas fodinaquatilis]|uniref:DUF983 domain-containing protein n=1 Tax=Aureimonas fodinaquatilis TaxID=2565783 RepID=A0A5B0DVT5_9HYPH|nr:DUF983 domain-containing protein [Aureimonas fodinaquatilis]KAA0970132.1 DUF983 domain-containing protein [Aureimonas fodinaquatilis]
MSNKGDITLQLGGEKSATDAGAPRPLMPALWSGFLCRCPNCNKGRLFSGFLRSVDHCQVCGEVYHHQRADDLPPYITIFVVGHIVVALFMAAEQLLDLPLWGHLAIWVPLTTVMTIGLMQPVKGATIALQWALRLHGFDKNSKEQH